MAIDAPLLTRALASVGNAVQWDNQEWSLLIRQARRANLLSRVACQPFEKVPDKAQQHFINAKTVADANARAVRLEVTEIQRVLSEESIKFVLLKGAAYLCAGFDFGKSRVYSDVDILVEKSKLNLAEKLFIQKDFDSLRR